MPKVRFPDGATVNFPPGTDPAVMQRESENFWRRRTAAKTPPMKVEGPLDNTPQYKNPVPSNAIAGGFTGEGEPIKLPRPQLTTIPGDWPGMKQPGNVDLLHRPSVPMNDGSGKSASVLSASFETDQGFVVVPRVSHEGTIMSNEEAWQYAQKHREHMGVFDSQEAADAYSEAVHQQQEKLGERGDVDMETGLRASLAEVLGLLPPSMRMKGTMQRPDCRVRRHDTRRIGEPRASSVESRFPGKVADMAGELVGLPSNLIQDVMLDPAGTVGQAIQQPSIAANMLLNPGSEGPPLPEYGHAANIRRGLLQTEAFLPAAIAGATQFMEPVTHALSGGLLTPASRNLVQGALDTSQQVNESAQAIPRQGPPDPFQVGPGDVEGYLSDLFAEQAPIMGGMLMTGALLGPAAGSIIAGQVLEEGTIVQQQLQQNGQMDSTSATVGGLITGALEGLPIYKALVRTRFGQDGMAKISSA